MSNESLSKKIEVIVNMFDNKTDNINIDDKSSFSYKISNTNELIINNNNRYTFKNIYEQESIENIYENDISQLINYVKNGYNATICTYGTLAEQMNDFLWNNNTLISLISQQLFNATSSQIVTVSMYHIINNKVIDLLYPSTKDILQLTTHIVTGTTLTNLCELVVENMQQLTTYLNEGKRCHELLLRRSLGSLLSANIFIDIRVQTTEKVFQGDASADAGVDQQPGQPGQEEEAIDNPTQSLSSAIPKEIIKESLLRIVQLATVTTQSFHENLSLKSLNNVIDQLHAKVPLDQLNFNQSKCVKLLENALLANSLCLFITFLAKPLTKDQQQQQELNLTIIKQCNKLQQIKAAQQNMSINVNNVNEILAELRLKIKNLNLYFKSAQYNPLSDHNKLNLKLYENLLQKYQK